MPARILVRRGRTSLVLLTLVAAVGYGMGAATVWLARPGPASPAQADRITPSARSSVVALGRLRPARLLTVVGPPGDQIADIFVKDGDTVAAGAELVRLVSQADRLAEVNLLKQQVESGKDQRELAIVNADRELQLAEAKLEELTTVTPLEINVQELNLGVLQKKLDALADEVRRLEALKQRSPTTVPDHDLSTQQLLLAQARADLQSGQVALQKARAAHQNSLKVAHAQLAAAQANQKFARADQSGKTLEQKLALAQLQLDRTTLKAPWPGRVLKISAVPGEATGPPQPVLQLADTATMTVVAEVYETDVKQVRAWCQAGRVRARIASRALPEELTGVVAPERIGTVISRNTVLDIDPTADADRRVFEVPVTLDQPAVAAQYVNLQVQVFLEPAP
jgi:HlyD family secretion protein